MRIEQSLISVVLPVYNSEKYIYDALVSITTQTYTNIEILVIVNGTTDNSIIEINKVNDSRIRMININESIGLIRALNIGIEESKGKYIARMDADDIALPTRFEKQVNFLDTNIEYGLCASWYKTFDGTNIIGKNKTDDQDIKINLLHQCHICHPSVILRKSILDNFNLEYSNNYPHSEDYALWIEMSGKTKFYTYPEVLLKYRDHENNISKLENYTQEKLSIDVKKEYFAKLGCLINNDEVLLYTTFAYSNFSLSISEINVINLIIRKLLKESTGDIIKLEKLEKYLSYKWNSLITNSNCSKVQLNQVHNKSFIGTEVNSLQENLVIKIKLLIKYFF